MRTRTTASKFLTSTRRAPEQQSSSTVATSTTTETVLPEDLQEDVYTDKRVAELALSGPEYPSTEKEEIIEGIAQANNGEVLSHEEVMAKYEKWRSK